MRSPFRVAVVALVMCALAHVPARAETYFGFTMGITHAPPAPTFTFRAPPRCVTVNGTKVSRLLETGPVDVFRFGGTFYAYSLGFWYRGSDPRGSFFVVDARDVPRAVLFVPPSWWKHHPQGNAVGQQGRGGPMPVAARENGHARGHDRH